MILIEVTKHLYLKIWMKDVEFDEAFIHPKDVYFSKNVVNFIQNAVLFKLITNPNHFSFKKS